MKSILLFAALLSASCIGRAEKLLACDVGPGPTIRVEVIRDLPIADTWMYSLRQNGVTTLLFIDADSSRGSSVDAACVGKKNHALVLSGEFAANARQGFVLTYRPGRDAPGRLDFAEKGSPDWLFLNTEETIVAVATKGLGETNKKFRIYRSATGLSGEPAAESADRLPGSRGLEKVNLK
jgi:hypothetical protein